MVLEQDRDHAAERSEDRWWTIRGLARLPSAAT
jgi:hypothetical protein